MINQDDFEGIIHDEELLREREVQTRLGKLDITDYEIDEFIRVDKQYYIGTYFTSKTMPILETTVYPETFYKYSNNAVLEYFEMMRLTQDNTEPVIDILQLHILNDVWNTYSVVVKTHWIRLIQRIWRAKRNRKTMCE